MQNPPPTQIPLPFADNAGSSYINAIPTPSQIGVQNGRASFYDGSPNCFATCSGGGGAAATARRQRRPRSSDRVLVTAVLRRLAILLFLSLLLPVTARAQCQANYAPPFATGGAVFGFLSQQWSAFFAGKADINGGYLCSPTISNPTFTGMPIFPGGQLGSMAYQNAGSVAITGGAISGVGITGGTISGAAITDSSVTGLPTPINPSDAATMAYAAERLPHVPDNTDTSGDGLSQVAVATYPDGVWRDAFYPSGTVPPSTPLAPPEFFTPQDGVCAVDDGGGCQDDPSGNSWVGHLTSSVDEREFGAYCDVMSLGQVGVAVSASAPNTIDLIDQPIASAYSNARIVVSDGIYDAANGPTFYSAITALASDGSGGTDVTVSTAWSDATIGPPATFTGTISGTTLTVSSVTGTIAVGQTITSGAASGTVITAGSGSSWTVSASQDVGPITMDSAFVEYVWIGHDDAAATNAAITRAGSSALARPEVVSGGQSCGAYSEPVDVNYAITWNAGITGLGATNMPIASSGLLEITSGSGSTSGESCFVEAAFLPVNAVWMDANGTTRWHHCRIQDWLGTSSAPTAFSGASSVAQASVTGQIGGCTTPDYTCYLAVTAVSSGSVQLGDSLQGTDIPAATYVQANVPSTVSAYSSYCSGVSGIVDCYLVQSTGSSPAVSSETISALGLDVSVSGGCSGTGDYGLVSRGNADVLDRTMIVGCDSSGDLVLDLAPEASFSSATLDFYRDANGVVVGTFAGSSAGFHLDQSIVSQADYATIPSNRYGCALYNDASGQSYYDNTNFGDGIAQICAGPDSATLSVHGPGGVGNGYVSGSEEWNIRNAVIMDGATNTTFEGGWSVTGQLQLYDVSCAAPSLTVDGLGVGPDNGQGQYAPQNNIWIYTECASTTAKDVIVSPFALNDNAAGPPYLWALTTGGSGTWKEFTGEQLMQMSLSMNPTLAYDAQAPLLAAQGINFNTMPIKSAERSICNGGTALQSAYTFKNSDAYCDFDIMADTSFAITVPDTLAENVSQAFSSTSWESRFVVISGSDTITVTPGSGAEVYNGGTEYCPSGCGDDTAVTLTAQIPYILWCPRNGNGTSAICYLYKEEN